MEANYKDAIRRITKRPALCCVMVLQRMFQMKIESINTSFWLVRQHRKYCRNPTKMHSKLSRSVDTSNTLHF